MSQQLTRSDVLKLAWLARISLSDAEADSLSQELTQILAYVEQLNQAQLDELAPTIQVTGLQHVTRPDVVKDYGYKAEDLLKNVPQVKDGQIMVKRVL